MHYQNKNWSKHRVEHTLETPLPEQAELSSTPLTGLTHILKKWMILKKNPYDIAKERNEELPISHYFQVSNY